MIVELPPQSPVDDLGRLLHAGDVAAQLALAVTHVDGALHAAGLTAADLTEVRVRTTDPGALVEVREVLDEYLAASGGAPVITVVEVDLLDDPEMVVTLDVHALRPAHHA
ncbi:Rid family hydrolase [Actinomarinicola tropica]|uniref:Rid family hydrolase n=1 Tax=Actinomarinicola tropica TaxID=2789776 RepID=UPI00189B0CF8|nr:Rid family hydrolase [Actinomarinicola tropica]